MYILRTVALGALTASAAKLIQSNDDGWAEINIRTFFDALQTSGQTTFISAPADNESGTGSSDAPATTVGNGGCELGSCAPGSPAEGNNASMPLFNYVNSYPVTSIKYGISTLAPTILGGAPDLAVAGPNVGNNLGTTVFISGTVGAATYAANTAQIPAIAFSGDTGDQTAWNVTAPDYSLIYADLSTNITNLILQDGAPYLPNGTYLNVNFPAAGAGTSCTDASQFEFVLSRIMPAVPILTPDDVNQCGSTRLPTETSVVDTDGCFVSISVGNASTKSDGNAEQQEVVKDRLAPYLSCLPSSQ